jgi:hypothetical protein
VADAGRTQLSARLTQAEADGGLGRRAQDPVGCVPHHPMVVNLGAVAARDGVERGLRAAGWLSLTRGAVGLVHAARIVPDEENTSVLAAGDSSASATAAQSGLDDIRQRLARLQSTMH